MRTFAGVVALLGVITAAVADAQTVHVSRAANETIIYIDLQNMPRSFEPIDEPTRIRVDDRSVVRIRVRNLSPLDQCSLGSRTPTPTEITNPIVALISNIPTSFAFDGGRAGSLTGALAPPLNRGFERMNPPNRSPRGIANDPIYRRIQRLQTTISEEFKSLVPDQIDQQQSLAAAQASLARYLADDYRGVNWQRFNPADPALVPIRQAYTDPLPTITRAAQLQAVVDSVSDGAAYLKETFKLALDEATLAALDDVRLLVDVDKAMAGLVTANNTALTTMQGTLQTSYLAAVRLHDDFVNVKLGNHIVALESAPSGQPVLAQDFVLGTDREATITGVLSCVTAADGKTPTTDPINYSILYQDIPRLTTSVGLLATLLDKVVIGTSATSAHPEGVFAIVDSGQMQALPMVYVNYRLTPYASATWPGHPEDEVPISAGISGGFGINPNSGTNEPEVFAGGDMAFGRLVIHPGVHWGRVQSLGGGFNLGDPVPVKFSGTAPVVWRYQPSFSIGFSVRVAPF